MKYLLTILISLFVICCSNSEPTHPTELPSTIVEEVESEEVVQNDSIPPVIEIKGMILLNGGKVTIGTNDQSFKTNERPAMEVILDYNFYMGIHEVTCGEYAETIKSTDLKVPEKCDQDSLPVTDITYYDAVLYANAKSKLKGYDTAYTYRKAVFDSEGHCTYLEGFSFHADTKAFRLPTEAEWVYAATRAWDTSKSWNNGNSEYKLHTICSKEADSAGFCDMAGNAMEWVNDWMGAFHDTTITNYVGAPDGGDMEERIVKGGCYISSEKETNPYRRGDVYTVTSSTRAEYVGFRLAFGSIPNALWMSDDGISQTSIITPLAGNETVKGITGSYNTKLAFRNDVSGNIAIIDYQNGASSVKEITKGINAYHPEISPNGKWIAYCTGFEGISGKSTVYVQSLEEKTSVPIELNADNAVVPRWKILETGDTTIVFVTDAGNNKDEATFRSASTWQVTFASGKFGVPQKLFNGAYHGGISEDNSLAVTGARLLRAHVDGRDTVWYNGEQACNVSLAMDRSKRTAFLDFSGKTGKDFVGSNYSTHQRILIADSTGALIQSIQAPSGYTFDHTEWATDNTKTNIVAALTNMNGAHTKIVLVNPLDSSVTELVEGEELWHPNLWVKKKKVKQSSSSSATISSSSTIFSSSSSDISISSSSENEISSSSEILISSSSEDVISSSSEPIVPPEPNFELDLDSAGIYYNTSGAINQARQWRSTMEIFWQYKDVADIIILGSSRTDQGINPLLISPPYFAVNLASTANTIGGDYVFLKNYILPHMKKLKIIITGIDIDRWYAAWAHIFYTAYESYPGYVYDKNHNYWKDGYPEGLAEATYDSPGSMPANRPTRGFSIKEEQGWAEPSVEKAIWEDRDFRDYNINFNTLIDIINICEENNFILIGVITPQHPRYKETEFFGKYGISRNEAPEYIQQIANLSNDHPNFILMDENKMGNHDYTNEMAFDSDHLAVKGAAQLTARIDSLIKTLNIEP
jgi:uncharacterized protein (TIGR02171 family)